MILIDQYAYINRLKQTHPIEKMILSIFLLLFTLLVKDRFVSLVIFIIMSSITVFAAKIPLSYYFKLLLLPSFFLLSGMLSILFSFASRNTILPTVVWSKSFGNWQMFISLSNVESVVTLFFVVLSSISCLYFLTLTTPVHVILQVLRKWKVPQLLIEITELTYRFIFIFLETSVKIYQAQQSRLGYRNARLWIHSISLLISSLFIEVFQRAKELTIAMDSRGYTEDIVYLDDIYKFSTRNWLIIFGIVIIIVTIYFQFGGNQ